MNGHHKRAKYKIESIKHAAIELFNQYGTKKVSMDEIAAKACVSKMTIYKYYHSKDVLIREVMLYIYEKKFVSAETLLKENIPFIEKLRGILSIKFESGDYLKGDLNSTFLDKDLEIRKFFEESFQDRAKKLLSLLLSEGKQEGYINDNVSSEIFYLYLEILNTGMKAKSEELHSVISNRDELDKLLDLYFFGIINKSK
ncbi:TetR/AcrR family transcriptional regulator [Oceanirhabdus seepicola]|uniref:TetR/AcrR family transcriptional regulator n=1 Tax=Oceanirhabdus seepicola TaxID=2828781 RepID=A0A9J6P597_9CLOT|nr:TetR/AcrR family transcriptional regulator [Oceanirhabdus seepicola]MCM1991731.1 TetR/AcrR family transcriptional regulator [Oceanirhabdus seepicola]